MRGRAEHVVRRLDNIDLRLLRIFVVLAESGSFSAAQVALNLSQSTLSTHLATLERTLGGTLCARGRRGFRLTPLGEITLGATRQLFTDIELFRERIGNLGGRLSGRLRVGVVDGVVSNARLGLQTALSRFVERAGTVFIDLELGTPHELEQAVIEGRRDIVVGPFSLRGPGVTYLPLARESQALYCGLRHPLFAADISQLTEAMITQARFSVRRYRQLDDLYRVNHPRANASVVHMEAQVMLILSGQYIGFLPRHIGDGWAERGLMRALRTEVYGFVSQHHAAFRRSDADQPLVSAFLKDLRWQASVPDQ